MKVYSVRKNHYNQATKKFYHRSHLYLTVLILAVHNSIQNAYAYAYKLNNEQIKSLYKQA